MAHQSWWIALTLGALTLSGCGDADHAASDETSVQSNELPSSSEASEVQPEKKLPTEKISLTIDKAQDILLNNEIKAQDTFTNKIVVLTGLFDGASVDREGKVELNFRRLMGGKYYAASAEIVNEERSDASNLNSGDLVEIVCKGYDPVYSITSPQFRDCSDIRLIEKSGNAADGAYQSMILSE